MPKRAGKQRVTIDLSHATWKRLKIAAALAGGHGGMRLIVERAVNAYLKRKGGHK